VILGPGAASWRP